MCALRAVFGSEFARLARLVGGYYTLWLEALRPIVCDDVREYTDMLSLKP